MLVRATMKGRLSLLLRCGRRFVSALPNCWSSTLARSSPCHHLDEYSQRVIADRIARDSLTADELWSEFDDFCDEHADDELEDEEWERGQEIVAALARDRERACRLVLHILEHPDKFTGWLEVFIARLAGELRLDTAVPLLADRIEDPDTYACQEAEWALQKIGTDAVVRELARRYVDGDWDIQVTVACALERVHTDLSVQTCLDLLKKEEDELVRGLLLEAVLINFCPDGIEPARQHVLNMAKSPEMLDVRSALLVACTLLGETFPELPLWQEDSQRDREFRRQWYKDHPIFPFTDDAEVDKDALADTDLADDGLFDDDEEPLLQVVRRNKRVGRNDPCPCGSGKKFKKCCYGKVDGGEETDTDHAAALGSFKSDAATNKYPIGTIAFYGPDDHTTTKIVASVVKHENAEPILERWVGTTVRDNPKVRRKIKELFDRHKVKSVITTDGNIGCPHEEGLDFPRGGDCPFCPFWVGKQGSARRD